MKKYLILMLGLLALTGCSNRPKGIRDCQLRLADMDVLEKKMTYVKMEVEIDATNPNGVDVVIDRMIFDLYANGQHIGSGASSFNEMLAPGESKILKGKVSIDYISSGLAILSILESASASYSLGAKVYYETSFGNYHAHQTISSAGVSFPFTD